MAVRLDHEFPPGVSYHALALETFARPDCDPVSGGDGGGETPVPIPNTAVKPSSADGTARSPCGRVGRRRISWWRPGPGDRSGPLRFGGMTLLPRPARALAPRLMALLLAVALSPAAAATEVRFPIAVD